MSADLFSTVTPYFIMLCALAAGICEGVMDWLQFKYEGLNMFWNPYYSWKNKWELGNPLYGEKFWGSSRWFVFLTDGWHLFKFLRNLSATVGYGLTLTLIFGTFTVLWFTLALRFLFWLGFWITYERRDR